jgi:hypothetical protein
MPFTDYLKTFKYTAAVSLLTAAAGPFEGRVCLLLKEVTQVLILKPKPSPMKVIASTPDNTIFTESSLSTRIELKKSCSIVFAESPDPFVIHGCWQSADLVTDQ